jgi:phage gp29-like protein
MAATLPLTSRRSQPKSSPEPARVAAMEIATERVATISGISQPYYQATVTDVSRIQAALRAAERGQTWLFYTIVRDMIASDTHLNAEWQKRKMVICGQPQSLQPADPNNRDDVAAVPVIQEAIDSCRNWQEALKHLLDATLYPMSVGEKIFNPVSLAEKKGRHFKYLTRYYLKEIAPVDYQLFNFQIPYQTFGAGDKNPNLQFNANDWEGWLRFYKTEPSGKIDHNLPESYAPNPDVHIIHRGILQSPTIPPNFGGLIRACLFWWLFKTQDRDWWTMMMSRFGQFIPVGKVNSSNKQAVADMRSMLAAGLQLGAIVIDKNAELEWGQVAGTDGSNQHKIYQEFANSEISKVVLGQSTSAAPPKSAFGAGTADQSETVRGDVRMWDIINLKWTLENQLFPQILSLNGQRGRVRIFWGGVRPGELQTIGRAMQSYYQAGLRPTEAGVKTLSEQGGVEFERVPDMLMGGQTGSKQKGGE